MLREQCAKRNCKMVNASLSRPPIYKRPANSASMARNIKSAVFPVCEGASYRAIALPGPITVEVLYNRVETPIG